MCLGRLCVVIGGDFGLSAYRVCRVRLWCVLLGVACVWLVCRFWMSVIRLLGVVRVVLVMIVLCRRRYRWEILCWLVL